MKRLICLLILLASTSAFAAGDWNKPAVDSTRLNYAAEIRTNFGELVKMMEGSTATNLPVGAKRWNSSTNKFEKWSGSAWGDLTTNHVFPTSISITSTSDTGGRYAKFNGGTGTYNFLIGAQQNVANAFEITPSTVAGGNTFSTPAMVVGSNGNVGIGTNSPGAKLVIDASAQSQTFLQQWRNSYDAGRGVGITIAGSAASGTAMLTSTSAAYNLDLGIDSVSKVRISSSNGNVLIGTTSDDTVNKLQINGSMFAVNSVTSTSSNESQLRLDKTGTGASTVYFYNNAVGSGMYDSTNSRIVWRYLQTASNNVDVPGRLTWGSKPAFRGALAYTGNSGNISASSSQNIALTTETYDTDTIHDNTTNNARLTVPSGVTRVRITANVLLWGVGTPAYPSSGYVICSVDKNAAAGPYGSNPQYQPYTSFNTATYSSCSITTAVLSVTAGDYFTINVGNSTNQPISYSGATVSMEIIE